MAEVLTHDELEGLVMALANGQERFTEADAQRVIAWAEGVRVENAVVDLVLGGLLVVSIDNDEIVFRVCTK